MKSFLSIILFSAMVTVFASCQIEEEKFVTEKPEDSRFTKVPLVEKLDEPMELEVLSDGRVIFIERKGKVKMYEPSNGGTKEIGFLDVFYESEDGLLGLAKDPGFDKNQWIYLYYSPSGSISINRLSRFTLVNDMIDIASEKIMLEIPHYRGCCHSGGSLEFDSKGNLFLSLGDDTTPFESDNYNPIDERKGRPENVDAQRSSGNSNDLRGGILRITPQPDGTYTIPEGNLFPVGTPDTRPEIYVKGNRNPFRISVDQKNGNLYWGEVGPDASNDSLRRGPRGYDEVNQAKKAGFFGWPYLIANNKPYWYYDFEKQESIFEYDPNAPVNNSPNNTGVKQLPPAQPAFIWYPYADSEDFPQLGSGGRNAMSGPVYYHDMFPKTEVKFPKYYHGKLFIYDWMRNWIFTVTMDENSDLDSMERFLPSVVFDKPVDMQFGPDGALYVLEYGTYWSAQNDDSGLYKIEFSAGNRKPIAKASVEKNQGAAPFTVQFSSEGSMDFDKEDSLLVYEWDFEGTGKVQSRDPNPSFTFEKTGIFKPILTVRDGDGKTDTYQLEVTVGNDPPLISVKMDHNQSFYWGNPSIDYQVMVMDKEDGEIQEEKILVTWDYLENGFDRVEAAEGHQIELPSATLMGQNLTVKSGCNACHGIDNPSIGPSYVSVAVKYESDQEGKNYLIQKITNGGGGVWGERQMPSHSHVPKGDIEAMVDYVLSLSPNKQSSPKNRIAAQGSLKLDQHSKTNQNGTYLLTVSYQDNGSNGISPILRREQIVLKNPLFLAAEADFFEGTAKVNLQDSKMVKFTEHQSYIGFSGIDLSDVKKLVFSIDPNQKTGWLEVRVGGQEGRIIGKTPVISEANRPRDNRNKWFDYSLELEPMTGRDDVYFVFKTETGVDIWGSFLMNTVRFEKD
ncbi:PQQ-dependent sugar dehydrogenase [Aquiflexum gelatinilyticum]|uniref:PQQ-dependent sugar dehydrogenase n=1 Tax=Aquiflexum gelatinilyticum TaxID=2961943 RepID=A0A9X2P2V0_9BACT|nr:PQQ-dependent sugar dehydrogenase [Aquiflexum gelatinilyticum]MCR9013972.1 PQQ-dependent sugar dehydrogenase [Aquiflexum gelatinilyticum]